MIPIHKREEAMRIFKACLIMLLVAGAARAADTLEAVIGRVGDQPILKSEVERQVQLYRMQVPQDPTPLDTLRKMALEQKIEHYLMLAQARKESVLVKDAEVDEVLNQRIAEMKAQFPDEEKFNAQLRAENTTLAQLKAKHRDEVRNMLTIQRLIDRNLRSKLTPPTTKELEAFFASHRDSIPGDPEKVDLSHILIAPKPGQKAIADARQKMAQVQEQLRLKKTFAEVAKRFSQDPGSKDNGGDLGWFGRNQMVPEFEQAAFALKPGQVSDVITTQFGFHIIKLLEKKDNQVHAAHILIMVVPSEADIAKARKTVTGLHRRVTTDGENFNKVAKTYSDDPEAKNTDGRLSGIPVEGFPAEIKDELAVLKEGETSDIIETPTGFHIIKLEKRYPAKPATLEAVREQLTEYLKSKKMQEMYEAWINKLKAQYHIERRI
jgi:peptidyl-prolyl cis-trans isomerase SurA